MTGTQGRKPNRLINEKSPYLLKHAFNPVDWRTWNKEALDKAKNDNKPIFLSVGYSSCHWCSVMEHESFEDESIADFVNKNFIPIKVDREERPDVDSYYMAAVQALTGQGGWPLTAFLTPDLKAFYGGTYFPPQPRYGMPSFRQVLEFVASLWRDRKDEITKQADQVTRALEDMQKADGGGPLSPALLDDGFIALAASFDAEKGGFGGAPKFPLPLSLEFMLRYNYRTGKELALSAVLKTLRAMASGGIHDHLGGGFHRYSTDRDWLVPHFEKMLYDNALLAGAYVHAYQATGEAALAEVAKGAIGWMLAELESKEGGFFSSQDADTEDGEGVYYTWTPEEVEAVLGGEGSEVFRRVYGVTRNGNFERGRSILHLAEPLGSVASKFALTAEKLEESLAKWRRLLYRARMKRPRPATDTKILTSWNGLAIAALAESYGTFGDKRYRTSAERAAGFVLAKNLRDGALLRRFAGGEAGIPAALEDYSFLGLGLLDLFEATSEPRWLAESVMLAEKMQSLLEDTEDGGFYTGGGDIPARLMETYDGPVPSGNSAAVMLLLRLSTLTGKDQFTRSADRALRRFQKAIDGNPAGHTFALMAADTAIKGAREVVVSAKTNREAEPFLRAFQGRFLPDVASFVVTDESFGPLSKLTPLTEGREPKSRPIAFVCQNFACKLPARSPSELKEQLGLSRS